VSGVTTRFLSWLSEKLVAAGRKVLVLVWDNASWHVSKEVRRWIGEHNREVKKGGKQGVRIISCYLPKKSPWLNPIEPKWTHGKRRVVEADGLCSVPMSWPSGYARPSVARITSICRLPNRLPDRALERTP
jgi:hypothetical protein